MHLQDREWRQAITAAGSGCIAALSVERYLVANDLLVEFHQVLFSSRNICFIMRSACNNIDLFSVRRYYHGGGCTILDREPTRP
jgi:hypothetical protein